MRIFNPIKSIKTYFSKRFRNKLNKQLSIKQRINHIEWLINEQQLIETKKSSLSAKQRNQVTLEVDFYIKNGYIVPK